MTTTVANPATLSTPASQSARVTREDRFNALIGAYMNDLFRYAYWLSGDRSIADDLVQETLVRAWKSLDRLNDPKAVKGWLLTIVKRENARRFERKALTRRRQSL